MGAGDNPDDCQPNQKFKAEHEALPSALKPGSDVWAVGDRTVNPTDLIRRPQPAEVSFPLLRLPLLRRNQGAGQPLVLGNIG